MNILLFNNNPVVNKLVTLSAQKTSNTVDTAQNTDDIESKKYDILIIDDELYSPQIMEEISNRAEYKKSLYICSKDAKPAEGFTKTLKKPFLPTDLVELLISLSKESKELNAPQFDLLDDTVSLDKSDELDDMEDVDSFDFDELDSLDEEIEDSKTSEFDELEAQEDIGFDELEDDLELDDTDMDSSSKTTKGVLDKEELQEVQNLLDETEAEDDDMLEDFDLEDDLEFDEDNKKLENELLEDSDDFSFDEEIDAKDELLEDLTDDTAPTSPSMEDDLDFAKEDDDFSFEEDAKEEENLFDEDEMKEEEFSFDETKIDEDEFSFDEESKEEQSSFDEEELSFDDTQEDLLDENISKAEETDTPIEDDFEDETDFDEESFDNEGDDLKTLESKIESAVKELSNEDLESEVDEDMLLDIDSLTSRDLKLAIGEEVEEDEFTEPQSKPLYNESLKEDAQVQKSIAHDGDDNSSNEGVEALKKLLKALSNEDVAASLKGMKININITLGDNQ